MKWRFLYLHFFFFYFFFFVPYNWRGFPIFPGTYIFIIVLFLIFWQIASRLDDPVAACDVEKDIQTVISAKGTGENIPEQMLPDFYAEDMNNIMNRERRKEVSFYMI